MSESAIMRAAAIMVSRFDPPCHLTADELYETVQIFEEETAHAELLEAATWDCDILWVAKELAEATGNLELAKLFNNRKLATEQVIAKAEGRG